MSDQLVIGVDIGTGSCKGVAMTKDGGIVASSSVPLITISDVPMCAEQSAGDVWQAVTIVVRKIVEQVGVEKLRGISFSGAMHSLLAVGEDNQPLSRATIWADQRGVADADMLAEPIDKRKFYHRTGCPMLGIYYAGRLNWLRKFNGDLFDKARRFVGLKDYVLHQLTGIWCMDVSLASSTGLLDIHKLQWDSEALRLAGIGEERLAKLTAIDEVVGYVTDEASFATGLPIDLPVVAGGSDGALANIGAGAYTSGSVVITIGTSAAVRIIVDQPQIDQSRKMWCYAMGNGQWLFGGAMNNGGLAMEHIRRKYYGKMDRDAGYTVMFDEAANVPRGSEDVCVLPFFFAERGTPWLPDAKGVISNPSQRGRGYVARATIEGVSMAIGQMLDMLVGVDDRDELTVQLTGGITENRLWCQTLADVLGCAVRALSVADASAIGAAMVGQRGLGIMSFDDIRCDTSQSVKNYIPDKNMSKVFCAMRERFDEMCRDYGIYDE